MLRRATPRLLQPPPPPTPAEGTGRSNSVSQGHKVPDADTGPFGTHQENTKSGCRGTVGLAAASQSKKYPQRQPRRRGSCRPQAAVISGQPPSLAEPVPPSIPSASGQAGRGDPAGGPFASRPPGAPAGPRPRGAPHRRRTRPRRTFRSTFRQLVQSR